MEYALVILPAVMLATWILLGQRRYRHWAGKSHVGHASIVGALMLFWLVWESVRISRIDTRSLGDHVLAAVVFVGLAVLVILHGVFESRWKRKR